MRGGFGMRGDGPSLSRLLNDPAIRQQAGISAEQAAKIRQQDSDFRRAQIRNRADLQVKQIDLQDLLAADKPDRAAIDSKLGEISAAQLVQAKSSIGYRLDMRDALTPAQRDKLRQLMTDRRRPNGGSGPGTGSGRRGNQGSGGPGQTNRRGTRGAAGAPNLQTPPPPPPPTSSN
jgi:Spy/CpxP family protein refolding chaperone